MARKFYVDSNGKRTGIIKLGDKYISKHPSNVTKDAIFTITRVTNQTGNGIAYYTLNKKIKGRKTGSAKVWWFREYATLLR